MQALELAFLTRSWVIPVPTKVPEASHREDSFAEQHSQSLVSNAKMG
jgi:hypothetical protein